MPAKLSTRTWWIIALAGCAVAMIPVVWFAVAATVGRAQWQLTSYAVVDDASTTVTFRVTRPANRAVTCELKAMDSHFGAVGLAEVTIPAGPERTLTRTETIRTTSRAVTGTVERCAVD